MVFESRNAMEAGMADAGDGAGIVGGEKRPAPQEMAMRALRPPRTISESRYWRGRPLTDRIAGDAFHPEWNYTIKPRQLAES